MPVPVKPNNEPRLSARQQVYNTLLAWITDGTLQPGEKILDSEIAAYFSMSRTPVREALQMLADQKLIDILPSRGSVVSQIDPKEIRGNYTLMGELNRTALMLAVPRINKEFIDHLEEINENMKQAAEQNDSQAIISYDRQFHDQFISLADNYFLTRFYETLYTNCQRTENLFFRRPEDPLVSVSHHSGIIQALRKGNYAEAGEYLLRNWTHTLEYMDID
ncbi:MAG: GntR family transcriptional regulator [Solobacterium sp.]|nr:GntR family transcriptional regulator [Erysipelotrichaceae bacterium]MBQ6592205.1 GntR family transcriptional regulator [Solobacterium sp.]MBR0478808.1 GntR family transcriptional regulator [Solobacterium sp.]